VQGLEALHGQAGFDIFVVARAIPLNANAQNILRGNLCSMSQISVADILELPVQERIQLVEVIWRSIAAVPHAIEVSPAQKIELEARLADFERNPEAGYSWDQVKAHLKNGSWRTA
jgi:putative addiction module component (TIGR02574 family)